MDVSTSMLWWVAAGIAVAAELTTGTFYLLMIAAWVGGGATVLWHWHRSRSPRAVAVARNRDAHLDIGERVHVDVWGDNRIARVVYRGSNWIAHLEPGVPASAGEHVVVAVEGNWLVLRPTSHS